MSSASNLLAMVLACGCSLSCLGAPVLRVCSDPNNMPYSNRQQQGFENRIVALIANDMGMEVSYFWFPQREKFFQKTLNSGVCDVVMGVPNGFDEADVTRPYYRSTYVFVSRRNRNLRIHSFDDPRLKTLRIGVHVLGEQDDSQPPVHALTSRGIVRNLVGYSIFGNLAEVNPSANLIAAVTKNDVDVAVAWGPLAGYFAKNASVPLDITPIDGDPVHPELPLMFDIGVGVREGDAALKQRLDAELVKRQPQITEILNSYGIPQFTMAASSAVAER
jgi:quinoprotein dehydrogenase-associated probable ABC transporter substrate-binding protein